jgi:hypothetical protein
MVLTNKFLFDVNLESSSKTYFFTILEPPFLILQRKMKFKMHLF